jgi:hypothetical protein
MTAAHWAITNLLFRYAELLDSADFDAVADLFADATLTAEGSSMHLEGRDAVRAHFTNSVRVHPDGLRTKHVTTNPIVEVDEAAGTATCRSYCMVLQASAPALPLQPIWAGRYHDSFVQTDGVWSFRTRHFITDLVGDMSEHLNVDLGSL